MNELVSLTFLLSVDPKDDLVLPNPHMSDGTPPFPAAQAPLTSPGHVERAMTSSGHVERQSVITDTRDAAFHLNNNGESGVRHGGAS